MRKLQLWLMDAKIRKKWKKVEQNRKAMEMLLQNKEAYTSERLIELNLETTRLGYEAKALEKQYFATLKNRSA